VSLQEDALLERLARATGILTLFASTSDEVGATSLSGVDLYVDPVGAMASARWQEPHACESWRSVGFKLVGVLPDAEGPGKPSIHFAKAVH
jgi:aminoglycoside 6'-N-acetyltransferase I